MKYSKNFFLDSKIQHLIQWEKFTPLSATKEHLKTPEIIDCTCTVASISSISRFACANVWSVRVVTKSIYVAFVGICFAFVNICQKKKRKKKKEKRMKNGICVLFKSHTCTCMWKKVEYSFAIFFVSCDSWVGPTVQTGIFQFSFQSSMIAFPCYS